MRTIAQSRTQRASAALVALVVLGRSVQASAQQHDAPAAETLFRDGREAAVRGDTQMACARFAESHRLDPALGTLLNLAECEERLGKIATAWAHAREVQERLPASDARVELARELVQRLERRLPRLTVRLAASAASTSRVSRDGVELGPGALGVALAVDPGAHTISVAAAGLGSRTYNVEVAEQETKVLVVEPAPTSAAAKAAGPPPIRVPPTRLPAWLLVGAGGVALGAGVTFGVLTAERYAITRDHCAATGVCDRVGFDASREGRSFDLVSTVSFVASGVLLAAGVAWLTLR